MLNLLPREEKKHLEREFWGRLSIVILGGVMVTFIIGLTLLLPSLFLSKIREQALIEQSSKLGDVSTKEKRSALIGLLQETRGKIDILYEKEEKTSLRTIFDTILSHRNRGITITGIYSTKGNDAVSLTLEGIALRRDSLITFSESLKDDSFFTDIQLPVSNLAEDRDIPFTIKVQGNF